MAQIQSITVEDRIRNGYRFELDKYLGEGFKIFSKEWMLFTIYGFVSVMILLFSLLTVIGFAVLIYPTILGFSIAADKVESGEKLEFNDFFGAYKNFGSHAVLGFIFMAAYILMMFPYFFMIFFVSIDDWPSNLAMGGMGLSMVFMLLMIVVIYALQVFLVFAPYLIHYGNYTAQSAISASFGLAKKNFWWILLFNFLIGLIAGIGQYACLIGVFATYPAAMLMNYMMVKRILMNDDYSEIDEIGNSFKV